MDKIPPFVGAPIIQLINDLLYRLYCDNMSFYQCGLSRQVFGQLRTTIKKITYILPSFPIAFPTTPIVQSYPHTEQASPLLMYSPFHSNRCVAQVQRTAVYVDVVGHGTTASSNKL